MQGGSPKKPKHGMGKGKNGTSPAGEPQTATSRRLKKNSPPGPTDDKPLASVQQMSLETPKHREDAAKALKAIEYTRFEGIKRTRADGSSYWLARELAPVLGYMNWQNFIKVINHAMIACDNSGHSVVHDFTEVSKIVTAGVTSKPVKDFELSRYACYLIVQNGDPRKEVIALGQT